MKFRQKKVPQILQVEATECGAASLAMILNYYGCKVSASEVRTRCGIGRDGVSALGIVKAAREYGLRARGLSLQLNEFKLINLPAVIHWEFNHFMVLERWTPKFVEVVDPAYGRRRLSAAEFEAGFTGVVISFEPGASFQRS